MFCVVMFTICQTVGALQVKPVERYDKQMNPVEWVTWQSFVVQFTNPLLAVSPLEIARYVEVSPPVWKYVVLLYSFIYLYTYRFRT